MNVGTIDIIMPFYGDPAQFKEAVLSVLAQDDPDWRLVVLDDCYPHWNPSSWLEGLQEPRITYERNPENLGVSRSFDRCIDLARNDYLVIPGCDDRFLPNYITTVRALIARFDQPEYVQPRVDVIDEGGSRARPLVDRVKALIQPRLTRDTELSGDAVVTTLMRGNWAYFPAICWRVDVLRNFHFAEEYEIVMDLALQLDILLDGGRFALSPTTAFQYRRHAASASSYTASDGTRFIEERDFYRAARSRLRAAGWRRASRAAAARMTSRLNALYQVPSALLHGDRAAVSLLLRHVFTR